MSSPTLIVGQDLTVAETVKILQTRKETFHLFGSKLSDLVISLDCGMEVYNDGRQGLILGIRTLTQVVYSVLQNWVSSKDENATLDTLIGALEDIGMLNSAEALIRFRDQYYENASISQPNEIIEADLQSGAIISGQIQEREEQLTNLEDTVNNANQIITIGKITLDMTKVLGNGSSGTVVFRGILDGVRQIAVKRIQPQCFTLADREIELLSKTDSHPNIIRLFCTENDRYFRYIALELCEATLRDWVEGRYCNDTIEGIQIIKEASEAIDYIHKSNIIHRDVKPDNILLVALANGKLKAVVADFGLSKKIEGERNSYSIGSGAVVGTNDWIAPEVIEKARTPSSGVRLTSAVDVFSLGCVYYYMLTYNMVGHGHHPFGDDEFLRLANIIRNKTDLSKLSNGYRGAVKLIRLMIDQDPEKRPSVEVPLKHPIFWSSTKIINFLSETNKWIKGNNGHLVLENLEVRAELVLGSGMDWKTRCASATSELRAIRKYNGGLVRDLLRAIRNLKQHDNEMSQDVRGVFGENGFVEYWMTQFPYLLPYTWGCFEVLKQEKEFQEFYDSAFDFGEYYPEIIW